MSSEDAALRRAAEHAIRWRRSGAERPVGPTASAEELRGRLARPLPERPTDAERIVDDLVRDTAGGLMGNDDGRFFAWVMGGTHPAALASDWLVSAWDQNAAIAATAPAMAVVEEVAGAWMLELLELPGEASFGFTSGCQMAHLTALAAARRRLLGERGWDPERHGLRDAPPLHVLSGAHGHETIDRAVGLLGLGTERITRVATTEDGRMDPAALFDALDALGGEPAVVCLSAGDINGGRFDDFATIVPRCATRAGTWVHVDGAFGLWARVSERHRRHLEGVELADSWATDGHKWLNTTFDVGFVAIRDRESHRGALSTEAPYIVDGGARDAVFWNPEWSRRARAVPLYAAIRGLGRTGIGEIVDRCCEAVARIVEGVGALPEGEVLLPAVTNQGLVRFLDPSGSDHDAFTDRVVAEIQADGGAFAGATTWRGRRAMRVSAVGWRTTARDAEDALGAVARALERSRP